MHKYIFASYITIHWHELNLHVVYFFMKCYYNFEKILKYNVYKNE
jgi:hypothetical protein